MSASGGLEEWAERFSGCRPGFPPCGRQRFAFYGPDARLTLQLPSPFLRSMPSRLISEGGEPGTADAWVVEEIVSYDEAFKRELIEFHNCIRTGREPRTSGADGLSDVRLCEGVARAHLSASRTRFAGSLVAPKAASAPAEAAVSAREAVGSDAPGGPR